MASDSRYISYRDIIAYLDIQKGDVVYVTSDILPLICVCRENQEHFDPNIFIDTLIEKIGPGGTLLFPTYHWGFCKGDTFDRCNTPSQTGALSNVALKRKDFRRTRHPIYSFAVWGKDQDYLCQLNNISAWGEDSPYGYFYRNHAKNLFIGINYKDGLTSVHYPEEKVGVNYRYFKDFSALYVDEGGIKKDATYRLYVRIPHLCTETKISPKLDELLLKQKAYEKYFINDVYFGIVNLHIVGNIMEHDIKTKAELVYPGQ